MSDLLRNIPHLLDKGKVVLFMVFPRYRYLLDGLSVIMLVNNPDRQLVDLDVVFGRT